MHHKRTPILFTSISSWSKKFTNINTQNETKMHVCNHFHASFAIDNKCDLIFIKLEFWELPLQNDFYIIFSGLFSFFLIHLICDCWNETKQFYIGSWKWILLEKTWFLKYMYKIRILFICTVLDWNLKIDTVINQQFDS
jgi:hypothetical protein